MKSDIDLNRVGAWSTKGAGAPKTLSTEPASDCPAYAELSAHLSELDNDVASLSDRLDRVEVETEAAVRYASGLDGDSASLGDLAMIHLHVDLSKLTRPCLAELHGAVETDQEREILFDRILETGPKGHPVPPTVLSVDGPCRIKGRVLVYGPGFMEAVTVGLWRDLLPVADRMRRATGDHSHMFLELAAYAGDRRASETTADQRAESKRLGLPLVSLFLGS